MEIKRNASGWIKKRVRELQEEFEKKSKKKIRIETADGTFLEVNAECGDVFMPISAWMQAVEEYLDQVNVN